MSIFIKNMALICVISIASVSAARGGEGGGGGGEGPSSQTSSAKLSASTTSSVTRTLDQGGRVCGDLPRVYRCDCFRQTYARAASRISGNPAYRDAHKALTQVERTLAQALQKNQDPSLPKSRRGFATYKPIKASAVPRVTRQAEQAMSKAQTTLLRSPSNKREHYARIAEAVNSTKVLLRSALLEGGLLRFAQNILGQDLRSRG